MSLAGSWLGRREVLLIDDWIVNYFLFVMVASVAAYFLPVKSLTLSETVLKAKIVGVFLLVLVLLTNIKF